MSLDPIEERIGAIPGLEQSIGAILWLPASNPRRWPGPVEGMDGFGAHARLVPAPDAGPAGLEVGWHVTIHSRVSPLRADENHVVGEPDYWRAHSEASEAVGLLIFIFAQALAPKQATECASPGCFLLPGSPKQLYNDEL